MSSDALNPFRVSCPRCQYSRCHIGFDSAGDPSLPDASSPDALSVGAGRPPDYRAVVALCPNCGVHFTVAGVMDSSAPTASPEKAADGPADSREPSTPPPARLAEAQPAPRSFRTIRVEFIKLAGCETLRASAVEAEREDYHRPGLSTISNADESHTQDGVNIYLAVPYFPGEAGTHRDTCPRVRNWLDAAKRVYRQRHPGCIIHDCL